MKAKRKFYISAIYTSPPTTMGGNTKILLEMINNLNHIYDFIVFTTEPETFKKNIRKKNLITIVPITYPFKKFNYFSHNQEISYIKSYFEDYFSKHAITKNDYFYSCSDFAPDVLPIYSLREKYDFTWIASLFLFIPNPIENLVNNYKFPFFKYVIYYFYQRYLFTKMLKKADLFLITNDFDKQYFPNKMRKKLYAIYGGVNIEQINEAKNSKVSNKVYDAVFCSRIHPQKGISQLLDIWSMVTREIPQAKLAIVGNGDETFVNALKRKAEKLGITKNVKWFGFVDNTEKYKIYLQSKMLLHATVYDNNGMVAAEALSSGIPVILYDLPALKKIYKKGCVKIQPRDKQQFSKTICNILTNSKIYSNIKLNNKDVDLIQAFWKWENRIDEFNKFLLK